MTTTFARPTDLIGRQKDWHQLEEAWNSARPELVFVTGRRRVGKSYLLTRFAKAVSGIYYQATQRTEAEQLASISAIVGRHFRDPALERGGPFPTWEGLLGYLRDRAAGAPLMIVLDEFPYLAAAVPALPSILQSEWDHSLASSKLKLVLSGSHITAMRRLEAIDAPLYGRRTRRLAVSSFPYQDIHALVPSYTARDVALTYGIFGDLPGHLALLDSNKSVTENVTSLLLEPSSRLYDEAQHMLDAFLGDAGIHYSIIDAIASGERTWSKIAGRVGKDSGSISRPMHWLEDMQIVERVTPVDEPAKSKRAIYRLRDPYVAFWHRFVAPLQRSGASDFGDAPELWQRFIAPHLDSYMGECFEEICRQFVRHARARLPFSPIRVGSWWTKDSSAEADVVALSERGELLVGECKWGTVDIHDLDRLQRRARMIAETIGQIRHVHLGLFSGREINDKSVAADIAAGKVLHWNLDDLMKGGSAD